MRPHNNFAGLLEMILPLSLSLALYYWQSVPRRLRRRTWRQSVAALGQPEILKCLLLIWNLHPVAPRHHLFIFAHGTAFHDRFALRDGCGYVYGHESAVDITIALCRP